MTVPEGLPVRLAMAALCDSAEILPDGRVSLTGACPEWWNAVAVPGIINPKLILVLQLSQPSELSVHFQFCLEQEGKTLSEMNFDMGPGARTLEYVAGAPEMRALAIDLQLEIAKVGAHRIVISSPEGAVQADIRFGVRLAP